MAGGEQTQHWIGRLGPRQHLRPALVRGGARLSWGPALRLREI